MIRLLPGPHILFDFSPVCVFKCQKASRRWMIRLLPGPHNRMWKSTCFSEPSVFLRKFTQWWYWPLIIRTIICNYDCTIYLYVSIQVYLYVSIQVAIRTVFNFLEFILANLNIQLETIFFNLCNSAWKSIVLSPWHFIKSYLNHPFCDTGQFAGRENI